MTDSSLKVFVSSTTSDLGTCRARVEQVLLDSDDILPRTQEHFPPDHRSLTQFLRDMIGECDAVICLVGHVYGAGPSEGNGPPRSYTQMEYDVARELDKPVFVFMTTEEHVPDRPTDEEAEAAERQRRHREALLEAHKCEMFSSAAQLALRVAHAVPRIQQVARKLAMFYRHPHSPPSYFSGRVEEMSQLRAALRCRTPSVIAVVGLGGQGKTTLVYESLRGGKSFPFAAGFGCTAFHAGYTFDMFLDEVLGYLLGGRFDKCAIPETAARVARLQELMQQRPVLLVIDGAERWLHGWNVGSQDPQDVETYEERLGSFHGFDEFLTAASGLSNGSHVILTSRALPAVLDDAERVVVPVHREDDMDLSLHGLDPEASVALLRSLGVKGDTEQIAGVAARYAYHPLALTVLGGLLAKKYGGRLARLDKVAALDPRRSLFQLFEESRKNLPGGAAAEALLKVASHCLEDPPLVLLAAILSELSAGNPVDCDDLLEHAVTLNDWHLVRWDGEREVVALHPLVKQYFAAQADRPESSTIHQGLSRWYEQQPILDGASTLEHVSYRVLAIEHALRAGDLGRCGELAFASLTPLYSFVEWLAAFGHLAAGIELLGRLAAAATGANQAELLNAKGALCRRLGDLDGALLSLGSAIQTLDNAADAHTPGHRASLAAALVNRANVHRQRAAYDDALNDSSRGVEIWEGLSHDDGSTRLQLASALVNRATLLRDMGHLRRAVDDCTVAITLHRREMDAVLQKIDGPLALALVNRGNALADLHRHEAALEDYNAAAGVFSLLLQIGQNEFRPQLACVDVWRGTVLEALGRSQEALSSFERGLPVLRQLVDAGRADLEPTLALAMLDRSKTFAALGRWDDALRDAADAVASYGRLVEAGRTDLEGFFTHALLSSALLEHRAGRKRAAAEDRRRGMEIGRRLIRREVVDVLVIYVRYLILIAIDLLDDNPDQAVGLLQEALDESECVLQRPTPSEALQVDLREMLDRLGPTMPVLEKCDFDTSRISRLNDLVTAD